MNLNFLLNPLFFLLLLFGQQVYAQTDPAQPNILLVIADDMGTDITPGYLSSPLMPSTPFLNSLRSSGLTFTNCWATPQCAPTRASFYSGKHGIKTGVQAVPGNLDLIHSSIFQELDAAYDKAVIGKWHVSDPVDYTHPGQHGVDFYTGVFSGGVSDYYNWEKVENEMLTNNTNYVTTELTDEAIIWVNARANPWFLALTHVAPHNPFHVPPADLYTSTPTNTNVQKYRAAIEAMDTELQRLVDNIPAAVLTNTIIIFMGDNGTPNGVLQSYPLGRGKGNIYQGGVNVPLIVSGQGVTRSNATEDALTNSTDLFATILEISGASLPGGMHNSYSFYDFFTDANAVGRPYNYVDYVSDETGGDEFAVRDAQYKLLQFADGSQEFYDLLADPFEQNDLLLGTLTTAEQTAYDDLELEALYIRLDWSCRDLIQNGDETSIDVDGLYCGIVPPCNVDNSTSTSNIGCCEIPDGENEHYEIEYQDVRTITSSNFPNHEYCFTNNNIPTTKTYQFTMDATPQAASQPTSILDPSDNGPQTFFGIAENGVIIAPAPATPFIFENTNTGEYNWNWVFEPTNNQGNMMGLVRLDCASAHTGPQGYHYHGNMFEYAENIQPGISTTTNPPAQPLHIGWAADGYPILYRFGPDANGDLSLLQPGYQLKSGDRPGDGVTAPCGPYNGKYTNDYEYVAGVGDLDECNGISQSITVNTACGPSTFDYFYVITDNFPQIGRCHIGTPDASFDDNFQTPCLIRMETQEVALASGESITVGSSTYDSPGTYQDVIMGSNGCDSVVVTKIEMALPLFLVSFSAINRNDQRVDLFWETNLESNVSHFEIETGDNYQQWRKVGEVKAEGHTTESHFYQFQEEWKALSASNRLYFRLKIMDLDGSFSYSPIRIVERNKDSHFKIIHDKNNKTIVLEATESWNVATEIIVSDVFGRVLQSSHFFLQEGRNEALQLQDLPTNLYFVSVWQESRLLETKRIVVTSQ